MPLFEYECSRCAHRFEVIQKFSDPLTRKCPVCSGPAKRLASAPAIQFKGSGWYVTDYGKGKGGEKNSKPPTEEKAKVEPKDSKDKKKTTKES
ncbi:MAG TPA: FmdB family zinc ribbon protein [Candidatus Polarisedimenticolia bacterium]|nr:FmdB family zinc ribbon protein [Candidatus Polarisedimenticolia bacterium]